MPEKTNQDRIKEYLVGEKGYLKSNLSDGKVIMLSGKWGSGKTHFWQNKIATDSLKKKLNDKRKVYTYVSLYGKSSIEEIENDIFSQAYFSAIGGENFITKGFATFTKRMTRYGSSKVANGLREEQKDNIERTALSRLNNGGIICFDDFERKSKDIDLNDLFGFITQLTLNFKCKVVVILNDDVFEGEEKKIFSNVKEKTVSKFLKYEPSIEELFNSIFDTDDRYRRLDKHKEIILKTIEETKELNARIYFQVIDNVVEWIDNKQKLTDNILRCLILVNINFINNHTILSIGRNDKKTFFKIKGFTNPFNSHMNLDISAIDYKTFISSIKNDIYIKEERAFETKNKTIDSFSGRRNLSKLKVNEILEFIELNSVYFKSIFFANNLKINLNIEDDLLLKINNFIETGILIDE